MLMSFPYSTPVLSHKKEFRLTALFKNTMLCFVGKSKLLPALQGGSCYLLFQPRFLSAQQMLILRSVLQAMYRLDIWEVSAGQQRRCEPCHSPGRVNWDSGDRRCWGPVLPGQRWVLPRPVQGQYGAAVVLTAGVAGAAASTVLWVQRGIDPFICFGLLEHKRIN